MILAMIGQLQFVVIRLNLSKKKKKKEEKPGREVSQEIRRSYYTKYIIGRTTCYWGLSMCCILVFP